MPYTHMHTQLSLHYIYMPLLWKESPRGSTIILHNNHYKTYLVYNYKSLAIKGSVNHSQPAYSTTKIRYYKDVVQSKIHTTERSFWRGRKAGDSESITMETTEGQIVNDQKPSQPYQQFIKSKWFEFLLAFVFIVCFLLLGLKTVCLEATVKDNQKMNMFKQQEYQDQLDALRQENFELKENMTSQNRQHQAEIALWGINAENTTRTQQRQIKILISTQRDISSDVAIIVDEVKQLRTSNSSNVSSLLEAHTDLSDQVDTRFNELFSRLNGTQTYVSEQITDFHYLYKEGTVDSTQLSGQVETLTEQITSMNDTISLLHTRLDTLTTETQADISQVSSNVQSSITELKKGQASIKSRLDTVEKQTHQPQQDTTEGSAEVKTSISELEKEQDITKRRLDAIEKQTNQSKQDMAKLSTLVNTSVSELKKEQGTTKSRLKKVEGRANQLETDVGAASDSLGKAVGRINSLEGDKDTLKENINTVTGRIKQIEDKEAANRQALQKATQRTNEQESKLSRLEYKSSAFDKEQQSHTKTLDKHTQKLATDVTRLNELKEHVWYLTIGEIVLGVVLSLLIVLLFCACCNK